MAEGMDANVSNKATKSMNEAGIQAHIMRQQELLGGLQKVTAVLEQNLSYILVPEEDVSDRENDRFDSYASALVSQIRESNEIITRVTAHINSINARVNI